MCSLLPQWLNGIFDKSELILIVGALDVKKPHEYPNFGMEKSF